MNHCAITFMLSSRGFARFARIRTGRGPRYGTKVRRDRADETNDFIDQHHPVRSIGSLRGISIDAADTASSGFALSGSRFAFFRLRPIGLALRAQMRRGAVCRPLAIEAWEFRVAVPAYVSWPILAALQTRRARHDC